MTAEEYYKEGNLHRKAGNFKEALTCFNEALALDPDSPAAVAKQMLEQQYAFYYKDLYNP